MDWVLGSASRSDGSSCPLTGWEPPMGAVPWNRWESHVHLMGAAHEPGGSLPRDYGPVGSLHGPCWEPRVDLMGGAYAPDGSLLER